MKKGDVIYDADLGMTAVILGIIETTAHSRGALKALYTVLYEDGSIEDICDYEATPIGELVNADRR